MARVAWRFEHEGLIEADARVPIGERTHPAGIHGGAGESGGGVEDEKIVCKALHLHELDAHAASIADAINRREPPRQSGAARADILVWTFEEPALRVKLFRSTRVFESAAEETVLDAALRAGLDVPHRCKGGNCGACRARLLEGEVAYPHGRPLGLSDVEMADGLVLLCRAHAHSDLLLETFAPGIAGALRVKRLPCRVERVERLAHDVKALYLRLPPAESFDFKPGQYIDVLLSKGRRRSFSIASPPHDARPLELHVRRAAGGEFSEQVFAEEMRGAVLHLEGPLGNSVYREIAAGAVPGAVAPGAAVPPLLLVGGGTGLAPLKSILRHVLEQGVPRRTTLYWGVRAERDLYAHAFLEETARQDPRFRYVPVLSEPSPAWKGRRGLVHAAVLAEVCGLEHHEIHASGPPQMIAAMRRDFTARGVRESAMSFDSFDYASDSPARQSMRAETKS
jgi:CDP-4-dehydro-6-deoxyglucose reductase